MAASSSDKFKLASNGTRPSPTTLTALKSIGASSISVGALTGWPTTTGVDFCIYNVDTSGNKIAGSQTDWSGVASGTTISSLTLRAGTDNGYSVGAIVEAGPVAAWADDMASGMAVEHNQNGTHGAVTATSVTSSGAVSGTALTASNGLTMSGGTFSLTGSYTGWINSPNTWTYASASTFTIAGTDVTARFPVGTKIKLTQTTVKYFYVTAASFSTDTTITVTGGTDYTLANAAITSPAYSYEATPQGFPNGFSYTPTETGFSSTTPTRVTRFWVNGRACTVSTTRSSNNTSNATSYTFSLPITARTVASQVWRGFGTGQNNGSALSTAVFVQVPSASTVANLYTDGNSSGWTSSNTKGADFDITYEI